MSKITVEGKGDFEVASDVRLVNAIEGYGVDILHRCGGYARCTTCRVEFIEGEPQQMTQAEKDKLAEKGLMGQVRLSCQILCDHDMVVRAISTMTSSGLDDAGPKPEAHITPEPAWTTK
jgi:ferredoxin